MKQHDPLLSEIDVFLREANMGESYFGKKAVGNSELVARLRAGGRVWPDTADKVRAAIVAMRAERSANGPDDTTSRPDARLSKSAGAA